MPDNQDAVKLLPLCGGYYWKETGSLGIGAVYSPEHKVVATCMTSREAQKYSDTMNAPTPREQQLEAQNKALWELVGECEGVLIAIRRNVKMDRCSHSDREAAMRNGIKSNCDQVLGVIQKAKEDHGGG